MSTYRRTGYKRVYIRNGAYFFVDTAGKWLRLCAAEDGEPMMLRQLAKLRNAPAQRPGSMLALIALWREKQLPAYEESTRKDYGLMLPKIESAFAELDVAELTSHHVMDLRDQWSDKPRSANKYQALVSVIMSYAIEKRMRTDNPCRDVKKMVVPKRKHYMRDDAFLAIRGATITGLRHNGTGKAWRNANGEMYACVYDFAYLTFARATDCRLLKWSDIEGGRILMQPSKTRDSSGVRLSIDISPEIQAVLDHAKSLGTVKSPIYVFHTLRGTPFTKSALASAWRRARERAGLVGERFRDIRPKAMSDAKRRGASLEQLRDAAGHTSVTTTEGYMRGVEVREVAVPLELPRSSKKVG